MRACFQSPEQWYHIWYFPRTYGWLIQLLIEQRHTKTHRGLFYAR